MAQLTTLFLIETPQTNRSIFLLLPVILMIGIGFESIKIKLRYIFLAALIFNLLMVGYFAVSLEAERTEKVWQPYNKNLESFIKNNPDKRIWISDSNSPNPGPAIAYLSNTPFTKTNLVNQPEYYRAWLNKIGQVSIGDLDKVKENVLKLVLDADIYIAAKDDPKFFNENFFKKTKAFSGYQIYEIKPDILKMYEK